MPDEKEYFARFGPGLQLRRILPWQKGSLQTDSGGLPPVPELPEKMKPANMFNPWRPEFLRSGAMDPTPVGTLSWQVKGRAANPKTRKSVAVDGNPLTYKKVGHRILASKRVTLGDISKVLFNEYRALQGSNPKKPKTPYAGGEQLKKAKNDTAYAILNDAHYAPGTEVAPPIVNARARRSKEYKRDFQNYKNTAWDAFANWFTGKDPVEGRGRYNFRSNNSMAPRRVGRKIDPQQTVYRRYGPFASSYGSTTPYVDIFNPPLNPDYAPQTRPDVKDKQR